MKITDFISLLGGLGLFLYGMQMMSNGLEAAAGNRMKKILERLTSNRFLGVLVGAGITAAIQSSSATTVMVVGFVNSGMMTLSQAVWIIMGANIGTTITGQLIALDVGALAPLFAFIGVALIVFIKKQRVHHYGKIIAGLGILFIGMDMMSSSMMPLRESEAFINLMTKFSNPVLGILAGTIFTAVIQSSSASVGILQALASSGVIGLSQAVYVLFGQNIGTCITAVLASIGTSRSAKRTTIIHLMFNIIGTIIFTIVCILTPFALFVEGLTPGNVSQQIANMHTIFNITTTILLLPFGNYLAKLATKILPDLPEEKSDVMHLEFIRPIPIENRGETKIGLSAIAITAIKKELQRMTSMARENVTMSFEAVRDANTSMLDDIRNREEYIDYLNKEISKYVSRTLVKERNPKDSQYMSALFKVCGNLERIGDHAMNIGEYTNMIKEKDITFSREVRGQLAMMQEVCEKALDMIDQIEQVGYSAETLKKIEDLEQQIDDMTEDFRNSQIERMQTGACSDEGCVIYSEMLTDFERIGDHILNIAQEMSGAVGD
ncbi:Na/Pi cotransporter family protein [uncultured Negativibacillus sp.]|uniref:Na/Pi cotransporter family protein n=1 Tax=uncultured Negativibacillus sp. TaxID=1980696 RepID=UPI0025EE4626|nr:Na/Pi cotransporter family protein [uncultured Negativibacillus sp.]